jgi:hypothetical protein
MTTPEEQAKIDADAAAETARLAAEEKDPVKLYDAFLATLDEDVRKEIEAHTKGLKAALVSERTLSKDGKAALSQLKVLQEAEAKRKTDEMSELDKTKAEKVAAEDKALKAQQELQTERVKSAVLAVAVKMSFIDPQDAYTLIDIATLETSDDGKLTGVDEALKALVKAKPYLVGEPNTAHINLNAGERGSPAKGALQEEIIKKKRRGYSPL